LTKREGQRRTNKNMGGPKTRGSNQCLEKKGIREKKKNIPKIPQSAGAGDPKTTEKKMFFERLKKRPVADRLKAKVTKNPVETTPKKKTPLHHCSKIGPEGLEKRRGKKKTKTAQL